MGSFYPYYRLDKFWGGICQIYVAGSAGEMCKYQGVSFTIDEQKSIDWILIPKEVLEELDRKKKEVYEENMAKWNEDAKQRKLADEKKTKTLKNRFWAWWNVRY